MRRGRIVQVYKRHVPAYKVMFTLKLRDKPPSPCIQCALQLVTFKRILRSFSGGGGKRKYELCSCSFGRKEQTARGDIPIFWNASQHAAPLKG
jgi:hypothetical protein